MNFENFENLIDGYTDQLNNLPEDNRSMLGGKLEKLIGNIKEEKRQVYLAEDKKKYPLKYGLSDDRKLLSEQRRANAFKFVNGVAPNIGATKISTVYHEQFLLTEIENNLNLENWDYLSGLFEATEMMLSQTEIGKGSTFLPRYEELKKDYTLKSGISESELQKNISILNTREAEAEYLIEAINKKEPAVILPRQFVKLDAQVKASGDKELGRKFLPLVDVVNNSLDFLTKKGVNANL